MNFFRKINTDPHETVLKGKSFRLAHSKGLFEAAFQLSPADREEMEKRSKAIEADLHAKIDAATATMNEKILAARGEATLATSAAHKASVAAKWQLFSDFFKLPSREQIAISETKVDHVVIAPEPVEAGHNADTAVA